MLVFNEGVPRSGKSYDAVKNHILPALKAGRTVYARLNGLNHEKIALHLEMPVEQVRALLIHVETRDVVATFQAVPPKSKFEGDGAGSWTIPEAMKNALFVIDEVHEFYVTGRQALPEPVEQFFALHGQNGMDGVIMTQAYKRLHAVIRARIERKNQFQKLTAVGLKSRYRVRYYTTIAPDKYESVGGQTLKYDPKIFPLYAGYAQGATNVEVYDAGGRSVWAKLSRPLIIAAVLLCFAIPVINRFLHGDVKLSKAPATPAHMTPPPKASAGRVDAPVADAAAPVKSAAAPTSHHGMYDTEGMPAEVAYVFEMSQQARPRVAAVLESSWRGTVGVIEWREDQGHVLERMSFDDLRAMGVQVNVKPYGVRIEWKKQVIVATQWPLDMPGTIPQDARSMPSAVAGSGGFDAGPQRSSPSDAKKNKWGERDTSNAYAPPQLTSVSAIGG